MPRSESKNLWIDLIVAIGLALSFTSVYGLIKHLARVNPMLLIGGLVVVCLVWGLRRYWKRAGARKGNR